MTLPQRRTGVALSAAPASLIPKERLTLNNIDASSIPATGADRSTIAMQIEVVTLPVSDVERAKAFYERLGWRMDIDLVRPDGTRTVQMTPPLSGCSIHFGTGITAAEPGSAGGLFLVVSDISAARDDLIARGVDVSEVVVRRPPGFESASRSYFARATFADPDGNAWILQEVTERLPGRTWDT